MHLNPNYVEKHFDKLELKDFNKALFDNAKYVVILMWDVENKTEICEVEIFTPQKAYWDTWAEIGGKWQIVESGNFNGAYDNRFDLAKERIRMFADDGFYYLSKTTMKATKNSAPRSGIKQLENSVRRMF